MGTNFTLRVKTSENFKHSSVLFRNLDFSFLDQIIFKTRHRKRNFLNTKYHLEPIIIFKVINYLTIL